MPTRILGSVFLVLIVLARTGAFAEQQTEDAVWRQHVLDGIAAGKSGNWEAAERELEAAIKISAQPMIAGLYDAATRLLALEYLEAGKWDESLKRWDRLIAITPGDKSLYQFRAGCRSGKGEFSLAIDDLTTVIRLDPKDMPAMKIRAQCYVAASKYDRALQDLVAAEELAPDDLKLKMAVVWLLATCPDATIRDGARAVKVGERYLKKTQVPEAQLARQLAAAYAEVGRYDDAIRLQKLAVLDSKGSAADELFDQMLHDIYKSKQPFHGAGPLWKLSPSAPIADK